MGTYGGRLNGAKFYAASMAAKYAVPALREELAKRPTDLVVSVFATGAVATARIHSAGQVQQFEVQVEAAKINLNRAERLLKEQVGTVRVVDDANQHPPRDEGEVGALPVSRPTS